VSPGLSLANVSLALRRHAAAAPERTAVIAPDGKRITFAALERRVDALSQGLSAAGLAPGDRASLFVPPGIEFIALTHALLRVGAVPVLIDPGMGKKHLLACVERMAPRALIAVPRAHAARLLFPRAFRSAEILVTTGRGPALGATPLARFEARPGAPFEVHEPDPDAEAAVLFTSGSTGPPKGVLTTHANFQAQLQALAELYALGPGEVDVACFPLFALFDHALGMTSVFPDLDPSRPGTCDPARVVAVLDGARATFTFGSPAIWERVLGYLESSDRRLAHLSCLTLAGAPVAPALALALRERLGPGAEVHVPYGATESLPVASIDGAALAAVRGRIEGGAGACLGRPAPGVRVALIRIQDDPIASFAPELCVASGAVGEICVQSAATTRAYAEDPAATALAKVRDASGALWHRMGDLGRVDAEGRLWFMGRKAHRIETPQGMLFPVPVENAFLGVPGVRRTALVGVGARGAERPVLVVEPAHGVSPKSALAEVERRRAAHPAARAITAVLLHKGFPVDVRHNAKIHRLALKAWAEERLA
jgi:acyl-CoA synthetase (AMP-forming)/AMP-acid ligase II